MRRLTIGVARADDLGVALDLACTGCGGATAADGWCPRCLTMRLVPGRPAKPVRTGRAQVSFGPVGRTLWTLGIIAAPLPVLVITEGLAGWGLALLWWGLITPWSMRDLWRRR